MLIAADKIIIFVCRQGQLKKFIKSFASKSRSFLLTFSKILAMLNFLKSQDFNHRLCDALGEK